MSPLLLALAIVAPAPKAAEPQVATVTLTLSGNDRKLVGPLGTQWQGIALSLLGSSSVVLDATDADWEKAIQGDHLLVRLPTPRTVRARGEPKDAAYELTELLIHMDGWSLKGLSIRAGGNVHQFTKYDGALWVTLTKQFLPIEDR